MGNDVLLFVKILSLIPWHWFCRFVLHVLTQAYPISKWCFLNISPSQPFWAWQTKGRRWAKQFPDRVCHGRVHNRLSMGSLRPLLLWGAISPSENFYDSYVGPVCGKIEEVELCQNSDFKEVLTTTVCLEVVKRHVVKKCSKGVLQKSVGKRLVSCCKDVLCWHVVTLCCEEMLTGCVVDAL